jgi:GNAT superfamily N-acetyltransferase
MQIQISHFDVNNSQYQHCLAIRFEVLRKPLGMQILPEDREKDLDSTHILLQVGGEAAGTVALRGNALRQMAVLDKFQGQGLGAKLVRHLEEIAKGRGIGEIMLDARFNAIPFYEKLGYECYSEIYDKIGIPHRDMKKAII